jgi:hypothetical protein
MFEAGKAEHERLVVKLWELCFPGEPGPEKLVTKDWQKIGF